MKLSNQNLYSVTPARWIAKFRFQLLIGLFVAVIIPISTHVLNSRFSFWEDRFVFNTAAGATAAFLLGLYLFRRVITFPGVGILSHVMPALAASYGLTLAVFFGLRLDYSRLTFGLSFALSTIFFFMVSTYLRQRKGQRFYVVPSESTLALSSIPGVAWVMLQEPALPHDANPVLIADLRAQLGSEWERMIAETAVAGHPVYHIKQVQESLTGRVEIEHLSENSFGSLVPNLSYRKLKRIGDVISSLAIFPVLVIPGLIVALLIKMESPGPAFFKQTRRGYRGQIFEMVKFRTMFHVDGENLNIDPDAAITKAGDKRITRMGRFLRRTRIDELPQIWNVLRGEMSWIGPRPEALPLSEWYTRELPFYNYRHIVRPGITGWAQVNQGHVADLTEVSAKLHYDFFYIKNFSAWLDVLILARTISIIVSGFGAK